MKQKHPATEAIDTKRAELDALYKERAEAIVRHFMGSESLTITGKHFDVVPSTVRKYLSQTLAEYNGDKWGARDQFLKMGTERGWRL